MASNMFPSQGTMDVFFEPVLANPELLVLGGSPVAAMVVQLAAGFGISVSVIGDSLGLDADQNV